MDTCSSETFNQITDVAGLALNIGLAAHLATSATISLTKYEANLVRLKAVGDFTKELAEREFKLAVQKFLAFKMTPLAAAKLSQSLASATFNDNGMVKWDVMDPTGLASIFNDFYRPIC